ncbi:hypothetical protein B0T21DRAFT_376581 [Apiosordaria backusii]|uniref:3'(2'),5'-bisphosphate nucleotidase n=1 Tax=Apiosordaria backusii TaxID=314023 RepID=A0AA40A758_9PEZI|nr:hypothetical protein B0T21DRAFT_376581 [Apiosordaria backusii]
MSEAGNINKYELMSTTTFTLFSRDLTTTTIHSPPNRPQSTTTMHLPLPPSQSPPITREDHSLSHELLIASLAIQRAALLTKRVLRTLETPPSPVICPSTPINGHSFFPSSPSSLHPSYNPNPNLTTRRLSIAKPDASPVTIADFAAQALLISAIHAHFPHDSFIGEEDSSSLRADPDLCAQVWELVHSTRLEDEQAEEMLGKRPESVGEMLGVIDLGCSSSPSSSQNGTGTKTKKRFWSMDPIDGTSAFLKGGQYAVSLALIDEHGKELLGVLACPNLPLRVVMNGKKIEEGVVDKDGMGVMLSAGVVRRVNRRRSSSSRQQYQEKVRVEELHFVDSSVSCATDSSKVEVYAAMVLGGREYVQVRFPQKPKGEAAPWCLWDHAGSSLIYTESGAGKVTDLEGKQIDFGTGRKLTNNWGLITADESVHGKILELVGEVLGDGKKQE